MNNEDFKFSDDEKQAFQDLGVSAVVLFGSRAMGTEKEKSDYDVGVLLCDEKLLYSAEKRKEIYSALYDILSSKIALLVNIDIVFLEQAPGELRAHVMKHGKAVFEADHRMFADFRERIMTESADFAPLREIFHQGILSRIA